MINGIFDLLNSRNSFVKDPSKAPMSKTNIDKLKKDVAKYTEYICNFKIEDLKTKNRISVISSERRTGFLGMIMSMTSALEVYNQCKKQKLGIDYLLTYKMSQDHIESFFSAVRRINGFNNNPSAFQFKTTYKRLLVHHEITGSKYGNCVAMDSTKILHVSSLICKESLLSLGITIDNVEFKKWLIMIIQMFYYIVITLLCAMTLFLILLDLLHVK